MNRISWLTIVFFLLAVVMCGCHRTEEHARNFQDSVRNVFLDGRGVN